MGSSASQALERVKKLKKERGKKKDTSGPEIQVFFLYKPASPEVRTYKQRVKKVAANN